MIKNNIRIEMNNRNMNFKKFKNLIFCQKI